MKDFAKRVNEHFNTIVASMDGLLAQQGVALETGILHLEDEGRVVIMLELEMPLILGIGVAEKLQERIRDLLIERNNPHFIIEEVELGMLEICNGFYEDITSLDEDDAIISTEIRLLVAKK